MCLLGPAHVPSTALQVPIGHLGPWERDPSLPLLKWCHLDLLAAGAVSCRPGVGKPWDRGLVVSFHILKQKKESFFSEAMQTMRFVQHRGPGAPVPAPVGSQS